MAMFQFHSVLQMSLVPGETRAVFSILRHERSPACYTREIAWNPEIPKTLHISSLDLTLDTSSCFDASSPEIRAE